LLQQTDIAGASAQDWDVVIAGSSFSAMFFLRGLPRGLSVLVVEKGRIVPQEALLSGQPRPREDFAMTNNSDHEKIWVAHTLFGGNSNCWWGQVPRFHPSDFALNETHGVAAPWPVSYDDLEPFYVETEEVMEVAGGGSDHILPRSAPFPFPPHAPSRSDAACQAARPDIWVPVPSARSNGGTRSVCCANGVCTLCPVDAKFTILNGAGAFERDEARLLTGLEIHRVEVAGGRATGVVLRDAEGRETTVRAGLVALGANAIWNSAILMRSGNRSPALGRYLHEQHSLNLHLDVAAPGYFGGSAITGHCYGFYDGPHRNEAAAVLVENYNAPNAIRPEPGKWTQRMKLKLIAEDIPQADNRVEMGEDDRPHIVWTGHSDYATAGLARAEAGLAEVLPFEIEGIAARWSPVSEAHIQGTHRMGEDPETSVVDGFLRTHDVPNLLALGAGAFPTCSAANPTLTLSALALRAGRAV
jgi:choline dehydrogenase-like flavoprotein